MKRFYLLVIFTIAAQWVQAQSIELSWANGLHGGAGDEIVQSVAVDGSGNVYVGGSFEGTVDFDPTLNTNSRTASGGIDAFFAKYSSSGNLLWVNQLGSSGDDEVYAVITDASGNVYVAGYFSGTVDFNPDPLAVGNLISTGFLDAFFGKYFSSGGLNWANRIGSSTDNDYSTCISVDVSGNVYVGGVFGGTADFDPAGATTLNRTSVGFDDMWFGKYTSGGGLLWANGMGSTDDDACRSIFAVGSFVWIAGYYSGTMNVNPAGALTNAGWLGGRDGFFGQYNAGDGTNSSRWGTMRSTTDDVITSVTADANYVYTAGYFESSATMFGANSTSQAKNSAGAQDIFVARHENATMNLLWLDAIGGLGDDGVDLLVADASTSNLYFSGYFHDVVDFDPGASVRELVSVDTYDAYAAKLSAASGTLIWAGSAGNTGLQEAASIAVDGSGNVYVGGTFEFNFDIDPTIQNFELTSDGFLDGFFAKFTPSPLAFEPLAQPVDDPNPPLGAGSYTTAPIFFDHASPVPSGYIAIRAIGAPPTAIPVDGTAYTAGSPIGSGGDVVAYIGAAAGFTEAGLIPCSTYYYNVYSFNGSGSAINYLQDTPFQSADFTDTSGNQGLIQAPSSQPTAMNPSSITNTAYNVTITPAGTTPLGYIAIRRAGSAPTGVTLVDGTVYPQGQAIGTGTIAYSGSPASFSETGLAAGIQYFYEIYAWNGCGSPVRKYQTASPLTGSVTTTGGGGLAAEPTAQPTIFGASPGSTTATINYTAAAGIPAGYLAIRRAGGAPTGAPADGTAYSAGVALGDGVVAYSGGAVTINDTGLSPSTQYFYKIFSFNGSSTSTNYLLTNPLQGNLTTTAGTTEPTAQPTNLSFSAITSTSYDFDFTAATGSPAGYIGIRRAGAAPTSPPVDGVTYTAQQALGDGFVNFIGTGTAYSQSSATPSTTYHLAIYSYSGSGSSINYRQASPLTGSVTTLSDVDDTGPAIIDNTPTKVAPGTALNVAVSVTDAESGVSSVSISYYSINGVDLQTGSFAQGTGSNWTYTIPGGFVTEQGVEYEVTATNGAGVDSYLDWKQVVVEHTGNGLSIQYNSAGQERTNYRMISIPLVLEKKSVNDIFVDDFGPYDKKVWRMFHYQGGAYTELNAGSTIEAGKGYWLISKEAKTIDTGAGLTVPTGIGNPFRISLSSGWNQIGNPFNFDVVWQDVLDDSDNTDLTLGKLRAYDGGATLTDATVLNKLRGAFVHMQNTSGQFLKIPVIKSGRTSDAPEIRFNQSLDSDTWAVPLALSSGETINEFGGVGMHPRASEENDKFDDFTLPRFFDYLELNHAKTLYHSAFTRDIVPTQQEYEWSFEVISSFPDEVINMKWDNSYLGTSEDQLVLWDVSRQFAVDMKAEDSYSFRKGDSREFSIFFGRKDYIREHVRPSSVVFHSISPIPADSEVTFAFSVPESGGEVRTKLEVYNLLGQRVATLANDVLDAGYQETTWKINDVQKPQPGVYLSVLRFGTFVAQKRLIIK